LQEKRRRVRSQNMQGNKGSEKSQPQVGGDFTAEFMTLHEGDELGRGEQNAKSGASQKQKIGEPSNVRMTRSPTRERATKKKRKIRPTPWGQ